MSFKVRGRVYEAESGLGMPKLIVKLLDKDLLFDDELGETTSDSTGKFEILYNDASSAYIVV